MRAQTPEQVHLTWLDAINAGDIEAVLQLYEAESAIVNPDGELIGGLDAVREVTAGLLALEPHFELRVARVLQCGDVALLLSPWTMAGKADGSPLTLHGTTTDVVRRGPDGTWRFVIDNPTGVEIVAAQLADRGVRS
jgi:uncharacterized protein (TIGR02246 family)